MEQTREHVLSVTRKDLVIQTFRAGGKGGQHQNKTETGVRVVHPPSGAVGEARDSRSQDQNKRAAFRKMADSVRFRSWVRDQHLQVARKVAEAMEPANLLVEVRRDGEWTPECLNT